MRIDLTSQLSDAEADQLEGTFLTNRAFDRLIDSDTEVYKPDGSLLLAYRDNVLSHSDCSAAYRSLREAAQISAARGTAAGNIHSNNGRPEEKIKAGNFYYRHLKRDGTFSNTTQQAKRVLSGVIGYMDRYQRIPYCRLTAFNMDKPEKFSAAIPFIKAVNDVFARTVPDRYAAQMEIVRKTSPDFFIHGTAFTTLTVNRNFQTAVHKDAGDYKPGFGVMAALRAGEFKGAYLVFPKYRVAVDMKNQGVLMADVHEFHGNTPMVGKPGTFERVSCVFYYRSNMIRCGSAQEELETAKQRRKGQGLYAKS